MGEYDKYKSNLNLQDTVKLDGLEFIDIDFQLLDDIFISDGWHLGLDEKMPDTIDIPEDENFKIVSKIFRPQQIKREFNYNGDIDFNDLTEEEINNILELR